MLALAMTLTACATVRESRLNPLNWFGSDSSEELLTTEPVGDTDQRPLIDQIISLQVDQTPEGAIVRAVGLPPTQGFWKAELVEVEQDDPTVLAYEFRIVPPIERNPQGTQRSREILVADAVSTAELRGISQIVVAGRQNQRSVNR